MSFDAVLARCLDKWSAERIALSPPIPLKEIRRVWDQFGRRLSHDAAKLYATIGGFAEYTLDESFYWCLWPWDYLKQRNAEEPSAGIQFCDHSIDIFRWELRFEDELHSSVWQFRPGNPAEPETLLDYDRTKIAPDLETFFRQYLDDPWRLM
jgi:hypothetical protein